MTARSLLQGMVDLLVIVVGLLALADGARTQGLLHPAAVVFTCAWVAALLLRRRCPWSPALAPVLLAAQGVALQGWPNDSGMTMLTLLLSAGLFGVGTPTWRAVAVAPLWPGAIGVLMLVSNYGESGLSDLFYPSLFSLTLLGGGVAIGRASDGRAAARSRTDEAERELETHRADVVDRERGRIAQDLRALIAEEIRGIRSQAITARERLTADDRRGAEHALLGIEDAGRETLADLRHMLGLLRSDMSDETLRPQPGIASLGAIVERGRACGVAIDLDVQGQLASLPRGIEVVIYRVVERTVERACRAGVEELTVRLRHEPDALDLHLSARGLGGSIGEDHLAIRERVVLYGGELVVGTDTHDRDVLHIRLPLSAAQEVTT